MEAIMFIYDWCTALIFDATNFLSWFSKPLNFGFGEIAPLLGLVSFAGLTAYLVIAIAKWLFV